MAQNDNLNDFADLQEAERQFGAVQKHIAAVVKDMANANKSMRLNFDNLGNVTNLEEQIKGSKAVAEGNKKVEVSLQGLTTAWEKNNAIMTSLNGHSKEYITNLKGVEQADKTAAQASTEASKQKTEAAKRETEASKQAASANIAQAKTETELAKQKEIETRYTIALTKEKERLEKAAAKEQARLDYLNSSYGQLNKEYNDAAKNAQNLGARKFQLEREVAAGNNIQVNNTELARLGPQLAEAQAQALKLHTALLSVDQAVGKSQRNVGNYNSAAFAMTQILREAPAFAYSFATGLLAVSNNVPILVDEIQKLNTANKDLVANGQKPVNIFKTLGASIFSFNNIITIAVAAVTILAARIGMGGDAMSEADKKAKAYKDSLRDLHYQMSQNYADEIQKTNELFAAAKDVGNAYNVRIEAIDKLVKLYPDLLSMLSQEVFLTGKAADEQERISSIISKQVKVEGLKKEIEAIAKQRIELQKEIDDYRQTAGGGFFGGNTFGIGQGEEDIKKKENAVKQLEKDMEDTRRTLAQFTAELNYALHPKHDGRILEDIRADIKGQEQLRDTTEAGTAAHENAIKKLVILNDELDKYLGKTDKTGKTPKDQTLKNEQDLTKAMAEEEAKRLRNAAEMQKMIYEDESKSLEERLHAFQNYSDLIYDAQIELITAERTQITQSLEEITRIEGKAADKRTQQEKDLLGKKALFAQQLENIDQDYNKTRLESIEKTSKGIVALQENEVKKRLDAIEQLNNNIDNQEGDALLKLKNSYESDAISFETYTKQKQNIEKKFQKERLMLTAQYLDYAIKATLAADPSTNVSKLQDALDKINSQIKKGASEKGKSNNVFGLSNEDYDNAVKVADGLIELEGQILNAVKARNQAELDALDRKQQAIDDTYNKEVEAIQRSEKSEKDKANLINSLSAQKQLKDQQLHKEEVKLKRKMAIADKVAALSGAIASGAKAVNVAMTAGPYIGQILAVITAAAAAVQVATILKTPLPQYRYGTQDHPGGLAIVGEVAKEVIKEPGKAPYLSPGTATVMNLPKHTQVFNQEQVLAGHMGMLTPQLIRGLNISNVNDYSKLERTTENGFNRIETAINNKQETYFHWDDGQLRKSVKRGNSWTHYLGKNNGKL